MVYGYNGYNGIILLSYYLLLPIFTGITSITVISSGNNMLIWENVVQ
ncbi:5290_t:CDS:2 [Rhizophagus irregularis]|nr:5290_t:CDS:2 [Rhizophagus irregularis]